MIFQLDPKQLQAAVACVDRFTDQLRRLNDNLEAGRPGTPGAEGSSSPARPFGDGGPR